MPSYTVKERALTVGDKSHEVGATVSMDKPSGDALVAAGRLSANRDLTKSPLDVPEPVAMPTDAEPVKAKKKA